MALTYLPAGVANAGAEAMFPSSTIGLTASATNGTTTLTFTSTEASLIQVGYTLTGTVDYVLENAGLQTLPITINSSSFPVIWQNASLGVVTWQNATLGTITWTVGGLSLSGFDAGKINARGNLLGLTLHSTSPDFTVIAHSMLYQDQSPLGA